MEAMFERELKPRTSLLSVSGTVPASSSTQMSQAQLRKGQIRQDFGTSEDSVRKFLLWRNRNYPTEVIQINDYIYMYLYIYV